MSLFVSWSRKRCTRCFSCFRDYATKLYLILSTALFFAFLYFIFERPSNVSAFLFSSQDETEPSKAESVAEKIKLFKDLQENMSSAGIDLLWSEYLLDHNYMRSYYCAFQWHANPN